MSDNQEIQHAEGARPTEELGASGLLTFGGQIEEAYLAELRYPAAYAKANEMRRRDPTIASMLNAVNLLARTASWTVEPAGSSDPDKRAAEFLQQNIDDMSITLEDAVEDMLSAIWFGWAWSEVVFKRRKGAGADPESKYDDGKVGWRKFAARRQSSFYKWELDENGGVQGLWQSVPMDRKKGTRYMPISKSLHFTAQRDMGNPEGLPLFEHAYEAWHFVKNLQILGGVGFERSFVGLPVFEYVEGFKPEEADKTAVEKVGKGLRQNEKAYVAVPSGNVKFRLESNSNQVAAPLLEWIKHFRISILQIILADFIALGTTASGGSYSLGADKSLLFLLAVDGWLDKLAHVDNLGIFNRYAVPKLFKYNTFDGITDYPRIKHSSVQKPDLGALAAYLQSLSSFIHPDELLEAELRKMGNLPAADEKTRFENQNPTQPNAPRSSPESLRGDEDSAKGDGPETGESESAEDSELAVPRPPARGQKWYFLSEWRKLRDEFKSAMKQNA